MADAEASSIGSRRCFLVATDSEHSTPTDALLPSWMVLWNDPAIFVFLTHFMGEFWRKGTHYMINKSNIEYYFVCIIVK